MRCRLHFAIECVGKHPTTRPAATSTLEICLELPVSLRCRVDVFTAVHESDKYHHVLLIDGCGYEPRILIRDYQPRSWLVGTWQKLDQENGTAILDDPFEHKFLRERYWQPLQGRDNLREQGEFACVYQKLS